MLVLHVVAPCFKKGNHVVGMWINNDGSSKPIHNPQDAAEALNNDPEMQVVVEETIAQEIEDKK